MLGLGLAINKGQAVPVPGLLKLYPATAAYSAYNLGNLRGAVTETEGGTRYVVSGAGTAAVNGEYVENGLSANGNKAYTLYSNGAVAFNMWSYSSTGWLITSSAVDSSLVFEDIYYEELTASTTPPALLSVAFSGALPTPTVASLTTRTVYNPVQRWRRGSDDALQMFTAAQVAGGTALTWANGDPLVLTTFANSGFESFSGASASGFSATNTSGTGFASSSMVAPIVAGETIKVTFDITINSGSPSLSVRNGAAGATVTSDKTEIYATSGSKEVVFTATGTGAFLVFGESDVPSDFVVSNFSVLRTDAYLLTEYDQSGNGPDIDITDLQPESGGLVGNVTAETATGYTFDVNNEGSDGYKNFCLNGSSSRTLTITFNAVLNSGSFTGVSVYAQPLPLLRPVVEGFNTFTLTNSIGTAPLLLVAGTSVCNATLSNIVVTQLDLAHDLTQTTAANQPLVVSGGALTVDANGNVAPSFDGANSYMTSSNYYAASMSVFAVLETDVAVNTTNYMRAIHLCDGTDSFQITRGGNTEIGEFMSKNSSFQAVNVAYNHGAIDEVKLLTAITNTDTAAYTDGLVQANATDGFLGAGTNATTTIGARDDLLASSFFYGKPAAILVYNTDQTANRAAIEAKLSTIVTTAIS